VSLFLHALLIHPIKTKETKSKQQNDGEFFSEVVMSKRETKRKEVTHQTPSCRFSGYCCGTPQCPSTFLNMCNSVRR
jgi:hypothetical protein